VATTAVQINAVFMWPPVCARRQLEERVLFYKHFFVRSYNID
jgi:hypothetical protein